MKNDLLLFHALTSLMQPLDSMDMGKCPAEKLFGNTHRLIEGIGHDGELGQVGQFVSN